VSCCLSNCAPPHHHTPPPAAAPRASQSHGFSLDSDEKEVEEPSPRARAGEERRDKAAGEAVQRPGWERRTPTDDRRWKRREDSEPRLFMACDDTPEPPDPLEGADKSSESVAMTTASSSSRGWGYRKKLYRPFSLQQENPGVAHHNINYGSV